MRVRAMFGNSNRATRDESEVFVLLVAMPASSQHLPMCLPWPLPASRTAKREFACVTPRFYGHISVANDSVCGRLGRGKRVGAPGVTSNDVLERWRLVPALRSGQGMPVQR